MLTRALNGKIWNCSAFADRIILIQRTFCVAFYHFYLYIVKLKDQSYVVYKYDDHIL